MTILGLGVASFMDLGAEFLRTILRAGSSGKNSVACGLHEANANGQLLVDFYLDAFAEGDCAGSDWIVILLLVIIVHIISWCTRWVIWEPLANRRMKGHKSWSESECKKFSMACTSALFFTLSAYFAFRILWPQDWLLDRSQWTPRRSAIDADYKFYYLLYASRFISDLISIFFEDRKQEAFIAAFIHHLATISLVLGSAHVGHTGYGGIIMFFFDWADIPLLFAKIFKYLSKEPKDTFQTIANRLFEVFAVLFFLTRNVYFTYVVHCVWMDLSNNFVNRCCQYLLNILVVLQSYWFVLVVQAALRQKQNGGNVEDVREENKDGKKNN